MVLMHINQRALVTESPHIEVEDTLSKFVRKVLNLDPTGRNMRVVKDQLATAFGLIHSAGYCPRRPRAHRQFANRHSL